MTTARQPRRRYEYPCEECGEMMTSTRRDKRFCSRACTKKGQAKRIGETGGRARRHESACDRCGTKFMSSRSDARYCSDFCRNRGYYKENREASLARSRAWVEANPEKRQEILARFSERHPDDGKDRYERLKADPERYAAEQEKKHQHYLEHKDEYLERAKRQRERFPTKMYSYKHGCDWDELIADLWHAQGGRCYLCGDPLDRDKDRDVQLDHDHSCCPLGRSCADCRRGLACQACNKLIGHAKDAPDRLHRIADNLAVANALVRQRMKESDQEKRGVLFDLDEAG